MSKCVEGLPTELLIKVDFTPPPRGGACFQGSDFGLSLVALGHSNERAKSPGRKGSGDGNNTTLRQIGKLCRAVPPQTMLGPVPSLSGFGQLGGC